ncbi:MAG: putative binding protein component of iron transporter precursor [Hyphomicrobiales bacterium]|nr:putative binding protein component of iron transporter precursor [Hyphomicrobiales bacterium]
MASLCLPRRHWLAAATILAALNGAPAFAADQAMIDAAKKEGQVVWYTTQIIDQFARPAAAAFEKRYGIKVSYVRANSNEVALRVMNEAKAGKMQADVFDGTGATAALKKEGVVAKWIPENAKRFPKEYVDAEGYWVATNLYVLTPGYNTELIKKGTEPKTFQDLLDPKYKGKIAWNSTSSTSAGPGFVGIVIETMGEEKGKAYLRELAKQQPSGLAVAARQVLDQVIAGEYAIALNIFNNHAVISAAKGAPVDWIPMDPALGVLSVISVTKDAPHPNAGRLFLEFLMSEDGQKIYRDAEYLPVDPNVPPKDLALRPDGVKFRAIYKTPEEVDREMPRWTEIFKSIFR